MTGTKRSTLAARGTALLPGFAMVTVTILVSIACFHYRGRFVCSEAKAARFDLACRTVQVSLVEKARELDDPRQREHAFQDLVHSQSGVSYRELDWCLFDHASTKLPASWHEQRARCLATADYSCLAENLRVAAAQLAEDP